MHGPLDHAVGVSIADTPLTKDILFRDPALSRFIPSFKSSRSFITHCSSSPYDLGYVVFNLHNCGVPNSSPCLFQNFPSFFNSDMCCICFLIACHSLYIIAFCSFSYLSFAFYFFSHFLFVNVLFLRSCSFYRSRRSNKIYSVSRPVVLSYSLRLLLIRFLTYVGSFGSFLIPKIYLWK
jgi:hypothetical protein